MAISENIKKYRKKSGHTQKSLAQKCGVATGTMQQYELGKRQPRIEQLEKIATALGVQISMLIDDDFFDAATLPNADYEDELLDIKFKSIMEDEKLSHEEKERMIQDLFSQMEIMQHMHENHAKIAGKHLLNSYFDSLNFIGQEKAIEQVELLTKIPEYTEPYKDNIMDDENF